MAETSGSSNALSQEELSRRKFLNLAINGVGAGITAVLAVPLAGYFLDPALRSAESKRAWVKLGAASDLTASPKPYNFQTVRKEGFMQQKVSATAYAFLDENGEVRALNNTCTHLGCPAGWDESKGKFFCPCHGGVYSKTGKKEAGPPPADLLVYDAKVEDGTVFISV